MKEDTVTTGEKIREKENKSEKRRKQTMKIKF